MTYDSNTKEVLARLALIRASVAAGAFSDALVAGLNAGMGAMKRRIFNQSLDATGGSLGGYEPTYARDRRREGRQTENKDLEFTGTLRRAIEVVTVNNRRAEIRITSDDQANIARYQEQQVYNLRTGAGGNEPTGGRVPIFELSPTEQSIVQTTTRALIQQRLNF